MEPPRTIVTTGASGGVGRATAAAFARQGARIGLITRQPDALGDTVSEVEHHGGSGLALPLDVADAGAVHAAADRVERELGPIDLWINSAMLTVFSPLDKLSAHELRRVTEVTYLGSAHGVMAALAHMRPRNRGTILQVGSALAYRGIPLQAAYCASKFAIRGLLASLRSELIYQGSRIRVCIVELPAVNTPQFDWARTHVEGARGLHLMVERAPACMDIAAGEYGYDPMYFRRMLQAGAVDVLQADATRCGGITGFIMAEALANAWNRPLSAHTAPSLHGHLGCVCPRVRNVEYFHDHARIEPMLFDGALIPQDGQLTPDLGRPGLGLVFKQSEAARFAH